MIRVAINGYGRIGRVAHRVIMERFAKELEVVAINAGSSTDIEGWMYLLKYDTVYGRLANHDIAFKPAEKVHIDFETEAPVIGSLIIDGKEIIVFNEKDALKLPWKYLGIDVVIESTGAFTKPELLAQHIEAGAKKAILSAPFKDEDAEGTFVLGVNAQNSSDIKGSAVSNASCTTNCITPIAQIMEDTFGVELAMMTTVHGYTSDQRLQDGGHKDYRRARAAAVNIIPTSTGATKTAEKVIPSLKDSFAGLSLRVPVPTGSLSDFTFVVKRETSIEEVNEAFEKAAQTQRYKNIIKVSHDPLVSSDIIGESYSAIVDSSLTQVVGGKMVKVIAWYDNEYGYANRLVEEVALLGKTS